MSASFQLESAITANDGASTGFTRTSAVGVAVGLNMFIISIVASLALYFLLSLHHQKWYLKWKQKMVHEGEKENDDN